MWISVRMDFTRTKDRNAEVNEGTRCHQPPLCTRHAATTAGWETGSLDLHLNCSLRSSPCTLSSNTRRSAKLLLAASVMVPVGAFNQPIPRINYQFSSSASQALWNESMKPPNQIMYYGFAQRPLVRYSEH